MNRPGAVQFGSHNRFRMSLPPSIGTRKLFRCSLVRQRQDSSSVAGLLHRHAFAQAAKARQLMVGQQLHFVGQSLFRVGGRAGTLNIAVSIGFPSALNFSIDNINFYIKFRSIDYSFFIRSSR